MDPKDLVDGLPQGVRVHASDDGVFAVRADLEREFLAAGYAPGEVPHPERADAIGKRPLGLVRAEGRAFLVRRYHHGGLLRWLTGARFASPSRPFDEWRVHERLHELGVAAPRVVAARAVRAFPFGWTLDLATERVEGASDLGELLARRRDGAAADPEWRRVLHAVGELIARMHAAGFEHADLTPRNLLVERASAGRPRLWVLDVDGSSFAAGSLSEERRVANLARLGRHLERMAGEHGAATTRVDRWRFLCAYAPDREERRRLARRLAARPVGGLHRLGWGLERRLGRGRGGAESHLGRDGAAS